MELHCDCVTTGGESHRIRGMAVVVNEMAETSHKGEDGRGGWRGGGGESRRESEGLGEREGGGVVSPAGLESWEELRNATGGERTALLLVGIAALGDSEGRGRGGGEGRRGLGERLRVSGG